MPKKTSDLNSSAFVASAAKRVLDELSGADQPPVDLFLLAQLRRVTRVHLRSMFLEGATYALDGGFDIAIRDETRQETIRLQLDDPRRPPLRLRQRFTLAHEIAHTLYYDLDRRRPLLIKGAPRGDRLEWNCNHAAAMFMLPDRPLRADLADRRVSLDTVLWISEKYEASSVVSILRIADVHNSNREDKAVIYAEGEGDALMIRAAFIPQHLQVVLRPPRAALADWGRSFLTRDFWAKRSWEREVELYGLPIRIQTRQHGTRNGVYVEVGVV